jgi:Sporulation related domain.
LKEKRKISFFSKAKELLVTIAISIAVTLFFATVDTHSIDQFMSNLRYKVLQIAGLEKPTAEIAKEIPRVSIVSEPGPKNLVEYPTKPAPDQQHVAEEETSTERWAIQVFSAPDQNQAELYKEKLTAAGFPVYTIPAVINGKLWIGIRVGFFKSANEAKEVSDTIQRKGLVPEGPFWIMKVSSRAKEIPKVSTVSEPAPKKSVEYLAKPALDRQHVMKEETSTERWAIQVFSAPDQNQAIAYKEKLTSAGFSVYTIPAIVKGKLWIRVRVGFFKSTNEAKEVSDTIQRKGLMPEGPFWIVKVSSKEKENFLRNGN